MSLLRVLTIGVAIVLVLTFCSGASAQVLIPAQIVTPAPIVVPTIVVPPVYTYVYPPVQVRIIPAPSYYIKVKPTRRSFRNLFQPWIPVYVIPPVSAPQVSATPNT